MRFARYYAGTEILGVVTNEAIHLTYDPVKVAFRSSETGDAGAHGWSVTDLYLRHPGDLTLPE